MHRLIAFVAILGAGCAQNPPHQPIAAASPVVVKRALEKPAPPTKVVGMEMPIIVEKRADAPSCEGLAEADCRVEPACGWTTAKTRSNRTRVSGYCRSN
jgi:hypothetical protein